VNKIGLLHVSLGTSSFPYSQLQQPTKTNMKKSFLKPTIASLLALSLIGAAFSAKAENKKTEVAKPATPAEGAKPATPAIPPVAAKGKPYGGTLSAVDKKAMTVTVKKKDSEKTFSVASTTKITKNGKPATLDDAVVGEEAGVYFKDADGGKAEAISLRLGAKPEKPANGDKKSKKTDKSESGAKPAETK
jgi:hypothetical protein